MPVFKGLGVSPGTGYGPVRRLLRDVPVPPPDARHGGDAAAERSRAVEALEAVAAALESQGARAGGDAAEILAAQALIARDPELGALVTSLVERGTAGARAIYDAFTKYRNMLAEASDYLAARTADLDDIRDRAIAHLAGIPFTGPPAEAGAQPYVLVARDLAPADTALLDTSIVAAFVTEEGGPTSHTAILARSKGIPAVVACAGAATLADGVPVLVDGDAGTVLADPPDREIARPARAASRVRTDGPGRTADGHRVPLLANIGSPADVATAIEYGAEGVGLLRTEFLFLHRDQAPGVAEQRAAYRPMLEAFPEVTVRVLDAGADKPLRFLPGTPGRNPALGDRGIRLLRAHPTVLADQLAALSSAAHDLPVRLRVMAPMVATAAEAAWFATMCREAGVPEAGVMIEVPAAALRATDLAREVGFFSIGGNDLVQYAFAADREAGGLAALHDPWQPALLDLISMAASAGVPCGFCGEAAADPMFARVLVGLGVTSLSMSARAIPDVRAALAATSLEQCRAIAASARLETHL